MIGLPEALLLLVLLAVFFGAGQLPQVMQALGRGVRDLKDAASGDEVEGDDEESKPSG